MAEQEVVNFDDFGFIDPLETAEVKELKESFVETKPEEIKPIEEKVEIDVLDELPTQEEIKEDTPLEEQEPPVNQYKAFADILKEEGILGEDEESEIETGEQLLEQMRKQSQMMAISELNQILNKFGPEYHAAFKAIYVDGVQPEQYFKTQAKIQSFKDLDLTDLENQKLVLKESWKAQGVSDATIKRRIQGFEDLGTLEEEANEAHSLLLEKEEKQLEQMSIQKQAEELQKQRERQFYEHNIGQLISQKLKDKEIDGIPMNQKEANELFDYMITPKWQTPTGELLTEFDNFWIQLKDPANYELRLKVAALAKKSFNLESIIKKEASKQTKNKFDFLAQKEKSAIRTNTFQDNFSINI